MTGYSLHVGLNVVDTSSYIPAPTVLAGCVNDANDMEALASGEGFRTRKLLDAQATSTALLSALDSLANTAVDGDIAFVSFSGHGGQIRDNTGDEDDGLDETWCLYDRQVLDDELYLKWSQFRSGVRIVVLSDSCHSGTVARSILAIATREALLRNPLGEEYWPTDVHVPKLQPRMMAPSVAAADSVRRRGALCSGEVCRGEHAEHGHRRGADPHLRLPGQPTLQRRRRQRPLHRDGAAGVGQCVVLGRLPLVPLGDRAQDADGSDAQLLHRGHGLGCVPGAAAVHAHRPRDLGAGGSGRLGRAHAAARDVAADAAPGRQRGGRALPAAEAGRRGRLAERGRTVRPRHGQCGARLPELARLDGRRGGRPGHVGGP